MRFTNSKDLETGLFVVEEIKLSTEISTRTARAADSKVFRNYVHECLDEPNQSTLFSIKGKNKIH